MEFHALKVVVTEEDLTAAATLALKRQSALRQVQVRVTVDNVHIKGVYASLVGVPFETRWEVSVRQGRVAARLAGVKVIGLGAGMLNSLLLGAIAEAAAREDALQVEGDTVLLDVDRLLAKNGFLSRTNLTAVRCLEGKLWIEAGDSV